MAIDATDGWKERNTGVPDGRNPRGAAAAGPAKTGVAAAGGAVTLCDMVDRKAQVNTKKRGCQEKRRSTNPGGGKETPPQKDTATNGRGRTQKLPLNKTKRRTARKAAEASHEAKISKTVRGFPLSCIWGASNRVGFRW